MVDFHCKGRGRYTANPPKILSRKRWKSIYQNSAKKQVFLVPKHYLSPFHVFIEIVPMQPLSPNVNKVCLCGSLKVSMFLTFRVICWWPESNQNMFQNRLLVACVSSIGPLARSDYHRTDRLGEQVLELIDMKHCHLELLRWEYRIRQCYGKSFSSSSSSCTIRILDRKKYVGFHNLFIKPYQILE